MLSAIDALPKPINGYVHGRCWGRDLHDAFRQEFGVGLASVLPSRQNSTVEFREIWIGQEPSVPLALQAVDRRGSVDGDDPGLNAAHLQDQLAADGR